MISAESHTKQIRLLNDYISALEKQMASVKKELEQHHRIEAESTKQLDAMQKEITKNRAEVSKLNEQLKRFINIERDYFAVAEQLEKQKKIQADLNAELVRIRKDLVTEVAKSKKMEGQLVAKRAECEQTAIRYKAELEESKKQQKNKERRIDELALLLTQEKKNSLAKLTSQQNAHLLAVKAKEEALSKLSGDFQQLKAKSAEDISQKDTSIGQLQQQLRDVNLVLAKKIQQLLAQQLRLAAKDKQFQELDKKSNQEKLLLMSTISKLREEKLTLEALNNASRGSISQNTKALEESLKRNSMLSQQKTELEENFGQLKQEREAGLRQLAQLKKSLKESYEIVEQLTKQKEENKAQIIAIKQQLKETEQQIKKLTQKCRQNEQFLTIKLQELAAKQQQIQGLNDEIDQANMHVQLLQSQLQETHTSNTKMQKKMEQTTNQLTEIMKESQILYQKQQEYEMFQTEFTRSKIQLKNNLDTEVNSRERKINELNNKILKLEKLFDQQRNQNIQKIRKFQAEKNAHGLALVEYAQEKSINSKKIDQLQISLAKSKESLDIINHEYSSFKKRKETESEQLNAKMKQIQKKSEKKSAKIEELNQQIAILENHAQNEKKNLNSSVRDKQQRMKTRHAKQLLELETSQAELLQQKDTQIAQLKKIVQQTTQSSESTIKELKEEVMFKEKTASQTIKKLEAEVASLEDEVKKLNLASIIDSQQRALQTDELGDLKKALQHANLTLKDLKNLMDSTRIQLENKNKQIEALENSNTMLRKQIINSIKNEQTSRKELASSKSKGNLLQTNNSKKSLHTIHGERVESRSSIISKPKPSIRSSADIFVMDDYHNKRDHMPTSKSMVGRVRDMRRVSVGMKQSLVEELTEFSGADEKSPISDQI